ncbi:hypothetical protein NMY22_g669 [Coprinellus aureogranulatus]|nr:hypothetical protein NMY22_g669 [Coprinellus aureogranulatus]
MLPISCHIHSILASALSDFDAQVRDFHDHHAEPSRRNTLYGQITARLHVNAEENLLPGHVVTNMIDGDTLVEKGPCKADPTVPTTLYYDIPDIERYNKEKQTAKDAFTKLKQQKLERRGKAGSKKGRTGSSGTIRVKDEPEEPEMHTIQIQRPARVQIPVESLLGPFDIEAMAPAPRKARILTLTPSAAAATLPTPPMSTTSTVDGAFAESQAASTSAAAASPKSSDGLEQQFTSGESEAMIIDQALDAEKSATPLTAMDVDQSPDASAISRANQELPPSIDVEGPSESPTPTISAQDPLPFGYQPASHWDLPSERPGPAQAETSAAGSLGPHGSPVSQVIGGGRPNLSVLVGQVKSIGLQRPAEPPRYHQFPASFMAPDAESDGAWRTHQPLHYPPSEALNFRSLSSASQAIDMRMLSLESPHASSPLPLHSLPLEVSQSSQDRHPPAFAGTNTIAIPSRQGARVPNGSPPQEKGRSKSSSDDGSDSEFKANQGSSNSFTSTKKPKPKTKEVATFPEDKKAKKRFQCGVKGCPATFTRRNDVERHMKSASAHRDYVQEWTDMQSKIGPALNPFRCEKCGRILSRADSAKRHMESGACGKRELPSEQAIAGKAGRDAGRR